MAQSQSTECDILVHLDKELAAGLDQLIKQRLVADLRDKKLVPDFIEDGTPAEAIATILSIKRRNILKGYRVPSRTSIVLDLIRDKIQSIK